MRVRSHAGRASNGIGGMGVNPSRASGGTLYNGCDGVRSSLSSSFTTTGIVRRGRSGVGLAIATLLPVSEERRLALAAQDDSDVERSASDSPRHQSRANFRIPDRSEYGIGSVQRLIGKKDLRRQPIDAGSKDGQTNM